MGFDVIFDEKLKHFETDVFDVIFDEHQTQSIHDEHLKNKETNQMMLTQQKDSSNFKIDQNNFIAQNYSNEWFNQYLGNNDQKTTFHRLLNIEESDDKEYEIKQLQ